MKKHLILAACAAVAMLASGCHMCTAPDPDMESCATINSETHAKNLEVIPEGLAYAKPVMVDTCDQFVPRFVSGERQTKAVSGAGYSYEEAFANAVSNCKKAAGCDYVVVVNVESKSLAHPHWFKWIWLFSVENYEVTITSYIPVYLEKLERVSSTPAEAVSSAASNTLINNTTINATKNEITSIVKSEVAAANQAAGMIKLSDIQVQINAKGESNDKAAVIYPVK